ncbi:hypothetical protein [Prevotella sp.]|uniref:hypothetical protein n=1 Tax=Prevotella sp. TaxID=59823 RepID=UPI003AB3B2FD
MKYILKIVCIFGIFYIIGCAQIKIRPQLMNRQECEYILVRDYFRRNEYVIKNDSSIKELFGLMQSANHCDIIKLPPKLILTIKGINYNQTFFINDDYIKDNERIIYRCKKNIENELYKIIEDEK